MDDLARRHGPPSLAARHWLIYAAIVLVSALIRFIWLDQIPPGLWYDEALYALDGYKVSQGHFALFFAEHGHPREPLFPWMLGLAFTLTEPTVLVARCVSAIFGTVAVALFFPVARRFLPSGWALAATATFAVFRWHIHFSRTIFRAGLASPMALLALWMFLRWRERRRPFEAVMCGLAIAAGLYTYISLRVMPVLVLCWIAWMVFDKTISWRRDAKQIALIFATAAMAFLPLAIDYALHPDHLFGRTGEITMFEKDVEVVQPDGSTEVVRVDKFPAEALYGILQNAWGVAKVWFIQGDYVPRHGVPYRPVFDPVTGLLFLFGTGLCVWWLIRAVISFLRKQGTLIEYDSGPVQLPPGFASFVLLTWFGAFAMASVFSFGAPNILRMQGASPVVILIMIIGLRCLTLYLPRAVSPGLRRALPVVVLVYFGALQLNDYFRVFPRDLRVREAFGADFFYAPAAAADSIAPQVDTVYIPEEFLQSLQVKFITIRRGNIVGYSPDEPLPAAPDTNAAWLITARSVGLAEQAGQDQASQLQDIQGAHRAETFTLPLPDKEGRLRAREPWAELWVRR